MCKVQRGKTVLRIVVHTKNLRADDREAVVFECVYRKPDAHEPGTGPGHGRVCRLEPRPIRDTGRKAAKWTKKVGASTGKG